MSKATEELKELLKADKSHLVKKVIIDKNGHPKTVYTLPLGTKKKSSPWKAVLGFFKLKTKADVKQKIEDDYRAAEADKKDISLEAWESHYIEYFKNKSKWDLMFSKNRPAGNKSSGPKKENKSSGPKEKKKSQWDSGIMKMIHGMYSSTEPVKAEKKTTVNKPRQEKKEESAAREGFYNEKPSEIQNVGTDVWGARRHNYDTYEKFDVDIEEMEKQQIATAYVTKKNLIGDYGLENKDERVKKGETSQKVYASFYVRHLLKKTPADTSQARQEYMNFCRAVTRLDNETTTAVDFLTGLTGLYVETKKIVKTSEYSSQPLTSLLTEWKNIQNPEKTIGEDLSRLLVVVSGNGSYSYRMNKKERNVIKTTRALIEAEASEDSYTDKDIESLMLGQTKAAGLKIKKGDLFTPSEKLKERAARTEWVTEPGKEEKVKRLEEKVKSVINDITGYLYASHRGENKQYTQELNKKYGTDYKSKKEMEDFLNTERIRLKVNIQDCKIKKKNYPVGKAEIVKAGKDSLTVAFRYEGEDRPSLYRIRPSDVSPEDVESVEKDPKKTKTHRADLYIESKVERTGGNTFDNLSTEEMQKKLSNDYQFKALQYGNSMPDDERHYHTKWSLQAFADLSELLGLPIEQVTARGKLGLAFGARGKGGALAHYEPGTKVINLTRSNGFGSMAHEWGHFLDNILAQGSSGFISQGRTGFKEIIYNPEKPLKHGTIYEAKIGGARGVTKKYFWNSEKDAWGQLKAKEEEPTNETKYYIFHSYSYTHGTLKEPTGSKTSDLAGRIAIASREHLEKAVEDNPAAKEAFLTNYWTAKTECFARAFECYVSDKLAGQNRENTYLASQKKTQRQEGKYIYPQGPVREEINKLFDEFFSEIRLNDSLQKALDYFYKKTGRVR